MKSCPAYCITQICHQDMPFTSNWRNGWWGINSDMVISIICSCLGERSFFVARWTPFTGTFTDVPWHDYEFVSPIMTYTLHKHFAVRLCLTLFGLQSMYTLCVWHLMTHYSSDGNKPWASYQIRKIAGCACAGNAGNVFPRRRFQRKPIVSDPGMHHGTCVTHVPWCMSGSLTCGDGENVPGAYAPAILRIWQEAHCMNKCWLSNRWREAPDDITPWSILMLTNCQLNPEILLLLKWVLW